MARRLVEVHEFDQCVNRLSNILLQVVFNFRQLQSLSVNLDLSTLATHIAHGTIRAVPYQIAGLVESALHSGEETGTPARLVDEHFGRLLGIIEISPPHRWPLYHQLTHAAHRS